MNNDHLDYHIIATTLSAGGARVRSGWHTKVIFSNFNRWGEDFERLVEKARTPHTDRARAFQQRR